MAIDARTRRPKIATIFGGLSGPAIKPIALRMVYQVHRAGVPLPISGIGGIQDATDAIEFFLAGATHRAGRHAELRRPRRLRTHRARSAERAWPPTASATCASWSAPCASDRRSPRAPR